MNYQQLDLFGTIKEKFKLDKPILLIELFGGIGSQAKALEILGLSFKHHKLCEWAYNSYVMYNLIHQKDFTDYSEGKSKEEMLERIKGTSINYNEPLTMEQLNKKPIEWIRNAYNCCIATNNLVDISNVKGKDLDFNDNVNQHIIMTYSFPCQDLSLAGQLKGASKGGGTRSGLLWQVERILDERVNDNLPLPNVLVMENVPNLLSQTFIKDFQLWEQKLASLGYSNHIKVLNGKEYGAIPQNRERVFMVSILGDYHYDFPLKINLKYKLKSFLYKNVDEKYYLTQKQIEDVQSWNAFEKPLDNMEKTNKTNISPTLTTRSGAYAAGMILVKDDEKNLKEQLCENLINSGIIQESDVIKHSFTKQIMSGKKKPIEKQDEMICLPTRCDCLGVVVKEELDGLCLDDRDKGFGTKIGDVIPTQRASRSGLKVFTKLNIRKLVPCEALKLMGFSEDDYNSIKEQFSDNAIYHCAGDSIITTCLVALFGSMTNLDYRKIIENYVETLKGDYENKYCNTKNNCLQ